MSEKLIYYLKLSSAGFKKGLQSAGRATQTFHNKVKSAFSKVGAYIKSSLAPLVLFTAAVYKLTTAISQGAKYYRQLSLEFANINTLLDGTGGLSSSAKNAVKEISKLYGIDALKNAKAYYSIVSKGISDEKEALDILQESNKLSVAGKADLTTATEALLTATNAYSNSNLSAKEAAEGLLSIVKSGRTTLDALSSTYGRVAEYASNAGISFKELNAYIAANTQSGQVTSEVITGLEATITNLIKVTPRAAKEAKRLGIEFGTTAIKTKGFVKFMQDLMRVTDKGKDEQVLSKLFESKEAVKSMQTTMKHFDRMMENVKNTTGLVDRGVNEVMRTYQKRLDKLVVANKLAWSTENITKFNFAVKSAGLGLSTDIGKVLDAIIGKWNSFTKSLYTKGKEPTKTPWWAKLLNPSGEKVESKLQTNTNQAKKIDQEDIKKQKEQQKTNNQTLNTNKTTTTTYEKLVDVKKKILELTRKSMDAISEGVKKVREETEKAIQAIKQVFFSGGALGLLADTSKLLKEEGVRPRAHYLRDEFQTKELTPERQKDIALAAKIAKDNAISIDRIIEAFRTLYQANPKGAKPNYVDIVNALRTDKNVMQSKTWDRSQRAANINIEDAKRQGRELEEKLRNESMIKLKQGVDKIVEAANENKKASDKMLKSSELFNDAINKYMEEQKKQRELYDKANKKGERLLKESEKKQVIVIKFKDEAKEFFESVEERAAQNKTQNPQAYGQKESAG